MDLFGYCESRTVPVMPEEYKGNTGKGCGYTKSAPRKWTDREIEWVRKLRADGFSNEEIGLSTGRTAVSIQIKLKRIGKNTDTYNEHHLRDKYQCNAEYFDWLKPDTVLDLFCGAKSYWRNNTIAKVTTNDIDVNVDADYHERAERLIHLLYYEGNKYDVVDLDPYGSAYDCFDLAIKMATKGIVITFGELGHKRWKRLDYVSRYYGIETMEKFTLKSLVEHCEMIARRNKKTLVPIISRTWDKIGRVWFEIRPIAITEQWGNLVK